METKKFKKTFVSTGHMYFVAALNGQRVYQRRTHAHIHIVNPAIVFVRVMCWSHPTSYIGAHIYIHAYVYIHRRATNSYCMNDKLVRQDGDGPRTLLSVVYRQDRSD